LFVVRGSRERGVLHGLWNFMTPQEPTSNCIRTGFSGLTVKQFENRKHNGLKLFEN
jgi:hypothetical protein